MEFCSMFGDILQELRKDRGWVQADLAKMINVSKSAIGSYESGLSEPSFCNLVKLAEIFNVNIDYLLGHTREAISWTDMGSEIKLEFGSIQLTTIKDSLQILDLHDTTIVVELMMKLRKLNQLEFLAQKPTTSSNAKCK